MEYQLLTPRDGEYPSELLSRVGADAPKILCYAGRLGNLRRFTMAVLSADSIPASAIMEANQLLFTLREYEMNYIGSWHSVMETEIFRLALFRKNLTLTLFSAKGLGKESYESFLKDRFSPPLHEFPERDEYFRRAGDAELLILSVTPPEVGRTVRKNVMARNWIACALADVIFIPFGATGTKTFSTCEKIVDAGIPAFTSPDDSNIGLQNLGIPPFSRKTVAKFLDELGARKPEPQGPQMQMKFVLDEATPSEQKRHGDEQQLLLWGNARGKSGVRHQNGE